MLVKNKRITKKKENKEVSLVKEVHRIIKNDRKLEKELKYLLVADNTYGAISYNGTDFFQCVTQVPQGDTDSNRDGDQLTINSLDFRIGIKTGSTTPTFLRVILFRWKPNTTPAYASILLDQHSTSNAPLSQYNHDQRQQYKILYDTLIMINSTYMTGHVVHHNCTKGFNPRQQFVAGSSTVATNMLYIMCVSDVASNGPSVVLSSKLTFYDS